MDYVTPQKSHYTVEQQASRLPTYLQEFYKERKLDRIKIDGNEIQGYFEYSFIDEKTYVLSPERSSGGVIDNLNSHATFLVPRLVIKYNYMHISDYRALMRLMQSKNEFTVECYDIVWDKRVTHKMYFAPPSMPTIHQRYLEVLGVTDYSIELIGTNSDLDLVGVVYHLNPPSDTGVSDATVAEDDIYSGQEVVIGEAATEITTNTFSGKYKFSNWNLEPIPSNKKLNVYVNGNSRTVTENLVLYAQWTEMTDHTLNFSYGLADPVVNDSNYTYETSRTISAGGSIGTLPTAPTPTVIAKDLNGDDEEYDDVYSNGKWYKTPIKTSTSDIVEDGDSYWTNRDSTIYLLYDVKKYKLELYVDGNLYQSNAEEDAITYNTPMNLPQLVKSGKRFDGWYTSSSYKEGTKRSGNMPPYDLTLYARFVD